MLSAISHSVDHKIQKGTGTADLTKLVQSESWNLVVQQCQSHPGEVRSWSCRPGFFEGVKDSDVLPIHEACALRPPVEVIDALIRAYPESVKARESAYRRLPLHIACRSHADVEVIRRLVKHYEIGAATDDILGRLPLHYACSNGADPAIINTLIESCPGSARAYDRRGWLPIHVLCSVGASVGVVQTLLDAFPPSVVLETNRGSTPRACADMCQNSAHYAEVTELLDRVQREYDASQPAPAKRPSSVRLLV